MTERKPGYFYGGSEVKKDGNTANFTQSNLCSRPRHLSLHEYLHRISIEHCNDHLKPTDIGREIMAELQEETESDFCLLPSLAQLPPHFAAFLRDNQVPEDAYNLPVIYRFLRVNEKLCSQISLEEIAAQFQQEVNDLANASSAGAPATPILVEPLDWFSSVGHRFIRLGVSHGIAGTPSYTSGKLYGIDISSAAAVVALGVEASDHVLDLCCAPGAKLSMISDALVCAERAVDAGDEGPFAGSVTGVDIASARLSACRTLCKKYELGNVRLFLDDACVFNCLAPPVRHLRAKGVPATDANKTIPEPVFPSDLTLNLPESLTRVPEIAAKSKRAMAKRNEVILDHLFFTSNWTICSVASELYDKVLVDAQCTLDASIRHLLRYNKVGWIDFEGNPSQVISELQKKMIFNAFRLLKPGGSLVYSTCSFCTAQNEDVITWLQQHEPSAEVAPIAWPAKFAVNISSGHIPHTVRFYPKHSGTSGMFIAKVIKRNTGTSSSSNLKPQE